MANYCNWQAVKRRVAASLHVADTALAAQWDDVCSEATKDAAAEIKRVFVLKSYTPDMIAASDDARVWNEMLGAFFALTRGSTLASYDMKAVEYLDCRKEFKEAAALVINGVAVAPPTSGDVGGIGYGRIAAADLLSDDATTAAGDPAADLFG